MDQEILTRRTIFNGADKDAIIDVCLRLSGTSLAEVLETDAKIKGHADHIIGAVLTQIEFGEGWIERQIDGAPGPMSEEMEANLIEACLFYGIEIDLLKHIDHRELYMYCHIYSEGQKQGIEGLESPKDKALYLAGNVIEEYLTFRGKQIEISGDKVLYNDAEYKFDDFLVEMFRDARSDQTAVFFPEAAAKMLKMGPTARVKTKYDILARRCGLPDITKEDEEELSALLKRYQSESDLIHGYYRRSRWSQGIQKMIAFGADLYVNGNIKGPIEQFFIYEYTPLRDRLVVSGAQVSLKAWLLGVKMAVFSAMDKAQKWQKISPMWKRKLVEDSKIALYYQGGIYAAIPDREIGRAVKAAIDQCFAELESAVEWGGEVDLMNIIEGQFGGLQIPDIVSAADELEIDYNKDVLIVEKNSSRSAGKAVSQVYELAAQRLKGFKRGDTIRTKELKERGYDNSDGRGIKRLVEKGILKKGVLQGRYEFLVDFNEEVSISV